MLFVCFTVCKMNVHKRCQKNVANNCGINTRDMAQILQEMGITTDKLTKGRKKVMKHTVSLNVQLLNCLKLTVIWFKTSVWISSCFHLGDTFKIIDSFVN